MENGECEVVITGLLAKTKLNMYSMHQRRDISPAAKIRYANAKWIQ